VIRVKKAVYLIPIVIFIGVALYVGHVSSKWVSYHSFEDRCLDCHLTTPGPGEGVGTFIKDVTAMCTTCHKEALELSHPVDVRPSMKVPASFPLNWKGELSCVTCHSAHDPGYGESHLRSRASGQGLCVMCHDNLESEMHTLSMDSAHVSGRPNARLGENRFGVGLDKLSMKCLSCHDAIFAKDADVANPLFTKNMYMYNIGSMGLSHPIGMSYAETKRKYMGAYRDISDIPKEIKLFGGAVGCGSCHSLYSKRHFELVMSNAGSRLCLGCHVK
jgi:predicted CXXCH cytochrome family protein